MSILDELKALEAGLSEKRQDWQGYVAPPKRKAGPRIGEFGGALTGLSAEEREIECNS